MPTRLVLLASLLIVAGPARPADRWLAVVSLDAPPELTFMGKSASEAFAREAQKQDLRVLTPSVVEERLGRAGTQELVRCADDARCLAAKAAPLGVDHVVGGWLRKRGDAYRVALVHADAKTGARLGGLEREIPIASRRLQRDVAATAPALLGGEQDATGILKVVTDVPGASVTIDGVSAGTTPVTRRVKPGRHEVRVSQVGHQDAAPVWVEVAADATVEHRPRLYPIPARDRPNRASRETSGTNVEIVR